MASKQKIGNYTVLRTLGVGSFGKVKLAVHSQTGHKVALKIIGRSKLAHSDMVGRVNREIQYLKMLRHPHIIKLYEVITTPTDIIMVIEYAGGELFNYIVERGRMNEKDARRFFQQMVSAVEYCHRRNIVHRDLKPENVLLDPYDNVKVADFGLSNIMKDGEFLQTSCGSPNYAAPEVINGKLYAGPEVDAWSCGVILYVMMCGRLPFDDDHIPALFKKITSGIFTMPGYLSQGARSLLSGLLQVDPLKRMSLAQVRQHPWFITDLPEYLKPLPDSTDIECLANLDESIVSELERQLEMDRKSLVLQLRQRGTNPAKVAYQLTLDNRHMLEQSRNSNKQGIRNFALASSPPAAFQLGSLGADLAPSESSLGGNSSNQMDSSDEEPSSIGILGSSLPRAAGHTLESQMYKMRLRGPQGQNPTAPRVQSPLVPSQQPKAPKPTDVASRATAQQAIGSGSNSMSSSPAGTPQNYFRAQLPPLAGAPGGEQSSSSIANLAKASPSSSNPYSHRTDSATASSRNSNEHIPNAEASAATAAAAASSPLARAVTDDGDVEMAESTPQRETIARKPTVTRKRAKLTRTRWHFGIRSRSPPADVMAEVYRALRQLEMTWKHFTPYHLRAKYTGKGPNQEVKIDLQLFKLDSRDNYLVDFKAVIPPPHSSDEQGDSGPTYRAGRSTLISPMPPFIQAARRRQLSAAPRPATFADYADVMGPINGADISMEPRSLDDQFLDSNYPIQLPAEIPSSMKSPIAAEFDRSDMLPQPDTLPARSVQRVGGDAMAVDSSDSMSTGSGTGIPIPGSVGQKGLDIPGKQASMAESAHTYGTPRSQGRAPGSYMPGSVVGRVSLARADVSLTADGVGAGSGASHLAQERVVNIFPFFDVCCKLITELAVPSQQSTVN
ncbi:Protein kinase [Coemansia sp. RSA 990]|nr:Protein kinase [Coemansia sp. RSA 990]KAJ2673839.1 Protein kinase [Coemansia sp. RSA 1085]